MLFSTYFGPVSGLVLDSSGLAYVAGSGAYDTGSGAEPVYIARIDSTPAAISLDSMASVAIPHPCGARLTGRKRNVLRFLGGNS